ncbi:Phosphopantetheine adenylyltransferase [Rickettsiales bacterium Ac37b]|nr:Phosphopantetheine adenylyltransferase [Rickettsiales bacterium Ac37b]
MSEKIGIYPGTFDPITYGHMDIISRALKVVDKLIIAVAIDGTKMPLFMPDERVEMVQVSTIDMSSVQVKSFSGLLVDFATQQGASVIVRGLRAISDFEYEFQMSCMNSKLASHIQTIFLPASEKTHFVSSRIVKEVYRLGGDVSGFVAEHIKEKLKRRFKL